MWWESNMYPHSSREVSTNSSGQPWPAGEMGWATPINALDMDLWICQNGQRQCHWPYGPWHWIDIPKKIKTSTHHSQRQRPMETPLLDLLDGLSCLVTWLWAIESSSPIRFLPLASPASPVATFTLSFLDFLDFFSSSGCSSMKSHLAEGSQFWVKSFGTTMGWFSCKNEYHLVMTNIAMECHGKSLINGGFNGKINHCPWLC